MAKLGDVTSQTVEVLESVQTPNIVDTNGSSGSNDYYLTIDSNGNIVWVAKSNVNL